VVKVHEDRSRPQPGVRQVLQCGQERIQSRLVRGGDTSWCQESTFSISTLPV
jgi:hypothetical protein